MKYFKPFSILLLSCVFLITLQSCEERPFVTDEPKVEGQKDRSQRFDSDPDEFPSKTIPGLNSVKFIPSRKGFEFENGEAKPLSSKLDADMSDLGKHWQKHKSLFLAYKNAQLNVYTYDDGSELLILEYEALGKKNYEYYYGFGRANVKGNDEPSIIKLDCKGQCSSEVQACTEIVNEMSGNLTCACQSNNCYMEMTWLN